MRAARRFAVPVAAALVLAATSVSAALGASNPETDKSLGPSATQGHFLGWLRDSSGAPQAWMMARCSLCHASSRDPIVG